MDTVKKITTFALAILLAVGTMIGALPTSVQAKALTGEEKTEYSSYLEKNALSSIAKFYLYDVNNDGTKDLVILDYGNGIMQTTKIYMHIGEKYMSLNYDGEVTGVSKNGIKVVYSTGSMGTVTSTQTSVYKISKTGKSSAKLVKLVESKNKSYKINGKKSTGKKYSAALKKYSFKKVKWIEKNSKNIAKYF